MTDKTLVNLIGSYMVNLSPEAKEVVKEMYKYRYAPRPEGTKPPKDYPKDLEKKIIKVLTIALNNRYNYLAIEE